MASVSEATTEIVQTKTDSCDNESKEVSEDVERKDLSNKELPTASSNNQMDEATEDVEPKVMSNENLQIGNLDNQTKIESDGIEPKNLSSELSQTHIKVNRQVRNFLKNILKDGLSKHIDVQKDEMMTVNKQLRMALQFLTTGAYHCTPESIENQQSSLNHYLNNFINCLIEVAPQFIKFPDSQDAVNVKQQFYDLGERECGTGFPNVLGVIDCTHVRLQTPTDRPEIYVNRHSHHSINVQIVCGPDLQIYNVLAAYPGRMEDSCIWQCSNLRHVVSEADMDNGWLVGDWEYPQEPWLMTPLATPKSPAEELYNKIHTLTWSPVKECIKMLKSRFHCLQSVLGYEPGKACAIITACCVLHNICLHFGDVVEMDPNLKKKRDVDIKPINTVNSMEEGVLMRDTLIKNNFSC